MLKFQLRMMFKHEKQLLHQFLRILYFSVNPLPHTDASGRLLTPPILPPLELKIEYFSAGFVNFHLWKVALKKWPLFRRAPPPKTCVRGVPEGGCAPLCAGGLKGGLPPSSLRKKMGLWEAGNGLWLILRQHVTNVEKSMTLSPSSKN